MPLVVATQLYSGSNDRSSKHTGGTGIQVQDHLYIILPFLDSFVMDEFKTGVKLYARLPVRQGDQKVFIAGVIKALQLLS